MRSVVGGFEGVIEPLKEWFEGKEALVEGKHDVRIGIARSRVDLAANPN